MQDIEKKDACMYTIFPKSYGNTKPHINNEWILKKVHFFLKQWLNSKSENTYVKYKPEQL